MDIDNFYQRNKDKWKFKLVKTIFIVIICPIIVLYVGRLLFFTPNLPDIDSNVIYNSGPLTERYKGLLKLELEENKTPYLIITVANNGKGGAENFNTEFSLLGINKIIDHSKKYIPPGLEEWVKEPIIIEDKRFREELERLPAGAAVEYKFILEKFIKSQDEFNCSFLSKDDNWTKSVKIIPRHSFAFRFSKNVAYAEDSPDGETKADIHKSGILIGGYDPFVMTNGLFHLVQKEKLISKNDAMEIKNIVETYKEGVLFGGINVLKFNELVINKLIDNGAITIEQARGILKKSKGAGGVLVGGYNVTILEVEILNALLENGMITLEEGQNIINQAKG
jgi:hypothetical protein